jgi:hypothetical protein
MPFTGQPLDDDHTVHAQPQVRDLPGATLDVDVVEGAGDQVGPVLVRDRVHRQQRELADGPAPFAELGGQHFERVLLHFVEQEAQRAGVDAEVDLVVAELAHRPQQVAVSADHQADVRVQPVEVHQRGDGGPERAGARVAVVDAEHAGIISGW